MGLQAKSFALRRDILDMVYRAKTGHIGGDFSVCDILNVLYNAVVDITPENFPSQDRDHFILSKGHSVEALYAVLCDKGFFPREDLLTVSQFQSRYIGHPNNKVNGIEMNSGSLGHGLPVGVGMALAMQQESQRDRWKSFGWNVLSAAGNDTAALKAAFDAAKQCTDKPTVILAETVKGCGVSFMENQAGWHHRVPTETEYAAAAAELEAKRKEAERRE